MFEPLRAPSAPQASGAAGRGQAAEGPDHPGAGGRAADAVSASEARAPVGDAGPTGTPRRGSSATPAGSTSRSQTARPTRTCCRSPTATSARARAAGTPKASPEPTAALQPAGHRSRPSRSSGIVLVCEGEKAADAAAALFPELTATTPMHGAKSPAKADWSPLERPAGRDLARPRRARPGLRRAGGPAGA